LAAAFGGKKERFRCHFDHGGNVFHGPLLHLHQSHFRGIWQRFGEHDGRKGLHHHHDAHWRWVLKYIMLKQQNIVINAEEKLHPNHFNPKTLKYSERTFLKFKEKGHHFMV